MKLRDPKSIIVISLYALANAVVIFIGLKDVPTSLVERKNAAPVAPEYTRVENLEYFNIKESLPVLSLKAEEMKSLGEERADFLYPFGIYHYSGKKKSLKYQANEAFYQKSEGSLKLVGDVKLADEMGEYEGLELTYFLKKDFIQGVGGVRFDGVDPQTLDKFFIVADKIEAYPKKQISEFAGSVNGKLTPKKKFQTPMTFRSEYLRLTQEKSLAELWGGVRIDRGNYLITGGNAELFFQNYNKSLKYFVLNDDVKVTETLRTPEGVVERRSFSESLEGFGSDKKMVLSGAPRVEQGKDIIKGYRITIRENAELIEVDDAMSDVQVKRKKN